MILTFGRKTRCGEGRRWTTEVKKPKGHNNTFWVISYDGIITPSSQHCRSWFSSICSLKNKKKLVNYL